MRHTQRGFAVYGDVKDERGQDVRVQQSSQDGGPYVWIFVDPPRGEPRCPQAVGGEVHGDPPFGCVCRAPHLTVEQAKAVRDALDAFIQGAS